MEMGKIEKGIKTIASTRTKIGYGKEVFQQTNNETAIGYQQKILNVYQENKEVYEKLLQSKDEQIALLKSLLGK